MLRLPIGNAFTAVAALAVLVACGDGGASAGRADTPEEAMAVMRELSTCLRANGLPQFPDPVLDQSGEPGFPSGAPTPPQSALNVCKSITDRLPAQGQRVRVPSQEEMASWRKFAQCMRDNGLRNWPDPNPDGTFSLPTELLDKRAFMSQLGACNQYNPDPNKGLKVLSPEDRNGNG
ncbi:hypothetical protein OHA25_37825 [Nonomuraea sp. NBC_00507]|uniref:hypothetical protein n=1 Tax=Nonomuraea sp. NBC_00507 TaxID=2976002 RepID=UPI002E192C82